MITQVTWTLTERMDSTHFPVCNHIERAKPKQKWYKTDCYTCKWKIVHNCRVRWIKSIKTYINNKNKSLNNLRHPTPHSRQQHGTLTCTSLLQYCSAAYTHVPPPSCPQATLELRCYLTSCCRSVRCGVERERERGGVKPSAKHVYQHSRMFHSQDLSQRHQVPYIVTEV